MAVVEEGTIHAVLNPDWEACVATMKLLGAWRCAISVGDGAVFTVVGPDTDQEFPWADTTYSLYSAAPGRCGDELVRGPFEALKQFIENNKNNSKMWTVRGERDPDD